VREISFQQALDVACRQQATSLELRAAMSLAHLWQQQGKRAAARDLLAPIYGRSTEDCDTAISRTPVHDWRRWRAQRRCIPAGVVPAEEEEADGRRE